MTKTTEAAIAASDRGERIELAILVSLTLVIGAGLFTLFVWAVTAW